MVAVGAVGLGARFLSSLCMQGNISQSMHSKFPDTTRQVIVNVEHGGMHQWLSSSCQIHCPRSRSSRVTFTSRQLYAIVLPGTQFHKPFGEEEQSARHFASYFSPAIPFPPHMLTSHAPQISWKADCSTTTIFFSHLTT